MVTEDKVKNFKKILSLLANYTKVVEAHKTLAQNKLFYCKFISSENFVRRFTVTCTLDAFTIGYPSLFKSTKIDMCSKAFF